MLSLPALHELRRVLDSLRGGSLCDGIAVVNAALGAISVGKSALKHRQGSVPFRLRSDGRSQHTCSRRAGTMARRAFRA